MSDSLRCGVQDIIVSFTLEVYVIKELVKMFKGISRNI